MNKPVLPDDGGQVRDARYTSQFFVIVDFCLEAVLIAVGSDEFVDELLSAKGDDFDVVGDFLDVEELVVIHGDEIAVKMRHVRLIFTDFEDKTITETAVLGIIGKGRFGAFSGDFESTRVPFDGHPESKSSFVVALPTVWKVEVNRTASCAMSIPKVVLFIIGILVPGDFLGHDL